MFPRNRSVLGSPLPLKLWVLQIILNLGQSLCCLSSVKSWRGMIVQAYSLDWALTESLTSGDQWGFVSGRFTTGALVKMVDKWQSCLEKRNEVHACGFLNLKKAFDRVPHCPLLDKLSTLNINPFIFCWLESYLIHQSQTVVVSGESFASCSFGYPPRVSSWASPVPVVYKWRYRSDH